MFFRSLHDSFIDYIAMLRIKMSFICNRARESMKKYRVDYTDLCILRGGRPIKNVAII